MPTRVRDDHGAHLRRASAVLDEAADLLRLGARENAHLIRRLAREALAEVEAGRDAAGPLGPSLARRYEEVEREAASLLHPRTG